VLGACLVYEFKEMSLNGHTDITVFAICLQSGAFLLMSPAILIRFGVSA
jgi:hypothetical protein